MAAVLIGKMIVSAVNPLLRLRRFTATPRTLSTLLLGPPRAAVTAGAGAKPSAAAVASLPSFRLLPCLQPALGFKTKGVIKKRCRDCYLVKRRGRWFIYCKTNPKHKQRQM
ncbi:39S ribosomal protein L36, mitochondrial [Pteropus alecto]|nr:39S ribosomal protein L36, mitochondrial [Pteropus alecto]